MKAMNMTGASCIDLIGVEHSSGGRSWRREESRGPWRRGTLAPVEGRGHLRVVGLLGLLCVLGCKSQPVPPVAATEAGASIEPSSPPGPRLEDPVLPTPGTELRGNTVFAPSTISGGNIPNAERVVAGMRAGFRACYNRGLKDDPKQTGSLTVVAKVGAAGEVVSATPTKVTGLNKDVADCVVRRVKSAQFDRPSTGSAQITIPITFVQE
jgi:hypothetical protein